VLSREELGMGFRVLMKIGGKAFDGRAGFEELAGGIKQNSTVEFIVVHGGGAEISEALKAARRETRFIDGIRVTQAEDIRIVEEVLSGRVNARIAAYLSDQGVPCVRLSGKTEGLFLVKPLVRGGQDYGFVGEIVHVNPAAVWTSLQGGEVPIVSPISADESGQSFNVKSDNAAASLAVGAQCTDLIYFTDVPGVQVDGRRCPSLSVQEAQDLIADGTAKGGMVAKLRSAFEALDGNVPRVHILQWQGPETLKEVVDGECRTGTTLHM
jgi:acetylglutamate kinase